MRRRDFIEGIAGSATVWPLAAHAQSVTGTIQRIGIIDDSSSWDPFRQQLRELNYVEGQNLAYVYLRTDGSPSQLDAAAAALAQLPVNVIAAFGTPRAKAAQRATKTIPIVAISISDPITAGLVTSLAHPGGNITGKPFSVRTSSPRNCKSSRMHSPERRALLIFGTPTTRPLLRFWRTCARPLLYST
jgi:putative tryptophan/tyrosine transport system substrate-binding protein